MTLLHLLWFLLGMALFIGTVLVDVSWWLRVVFAFGLGLWASLTISRRASQALHAVRVFIYRRRIAAIRKEL